MPLTLNATGLCVENFCRKARGQNNDDTEASPETRPGTLDGIVAPYGGTGTADDFWRLVRGPARRGLDEGTPAKDLTARIETLLGTS